MRTGRPRMRDARSGRPASWHAPPVRMTCPRGSAAIGGSGEPVAHHFKDFLDARLDDVHQRRARYELRLLALVVAQRRHRDHVALVRTPGQHSAIKRLDSLGVGDAGVEPAGDVHGDVVAAQRETVEMNEPSAEERPPSWWCRRPYRRRRCRDRPRRRRARRGRRHRGTRPWPRPRGGSVRPRASDCGRRRCRWWRHACRRRSASRACRADRGRRRRRRSNSRPAANAARRGRRAANGGCRRRARGRYRRPIRRSRRCRCRRRTVHWRAVRTRSTARPTRSRPRPCARRRRRPGEWPPRPVARLTTPPAFMPRATVWPKPIDLDGVAAAREHLLRRVRPQPCDHADDLARADVERGDERAVARRDRLHLRRQAVVEGVHASPPFFFLVWPCSASSRACGRGVGQAHADAIRQAQIDHGDVARQELLVAIELDQPVERGVDIGFRQRTSMPLVEPQIPAPLRHQDRRPQQRPDVGITVDNGEEILGLALGAAADHERQAEIAILDERLEHGAVVGDDAERGRPSATAQKRAAR